jgi:hypothetical protein
MTIIICLSSKSVYADPLLNIVFFSISRGERGWGLKII